MTPTEIIEQINTAYRKSIAKREAGIKSNSVELPHLTVDETRKVIATDGRFYCEGGHTVGSGKYDLFITPMNVFKDRGICTEAEGWIVVSMDNDDGKECVPDKELETT